VIGYRQFIQVALLLVSVPDPSEIELRRAISTLYYAAFHRIMRMVADSLAAGCEGEGPWLRLYRSLDHRSTWKRLIKASERQPRLRVCAEQYAQLLDDRQKADYDPTPFGMTRKTVIFRIMEIIDSFEVIDGMTAAEQLELSVALLPLPERRD
jgi:hypothetical protein